MKLEDIIKKRKPCVITIHTITGIVEYNGIIAEHDDIAYKVIPFKGKPFLVGKGSIADVIPLGFIDGIIKRVI